MTASSPRSRPLWLVPAGATGLLAAFLALPQARANDALFRTFAWTAGLLGLWTAGLLLRGRPFRAHWILRRPHWLQPIVQGSIYLYWGWHWRQVYDSAWLIAAQLAFAYAFDTLLAWTLDRDYELGMGPFPVIFSINLFLWFKPDWFYWQFVLVAIGFGAKQFLRWTKEGRSAHIFNPSSFPLAIASVFLIATGTADHTWGADIAVTLANPAHVFEFLFLISIPGQILFGVASMTMPAVLTAFALSSIYYGFTGVYYFFGPIPIATFLGMLLLFTDPSTAPKSESGRVVYGMLYGASVFVAYGLLDLAGQLTLYDKLLFVPFLNLGVRWLDRLGQSAWLARLDPARLWPHLTGRPRNAAWTGVWLAIFALLLVSHGVGDEHPGDRLPFWERACAEGRRNACRNLLTMEINFCDHGSGWACNEVALHARDSVLPPGFPASTVEALSFERACHLGFETGCANSRALSSGGALRRDVPRPIDYDIVLDTRGFPSRRTPLQIWQRACEQGWQQGCDSARSVATLR